MVIQKEKKAFESLIQSKKNLFVQIIDPKIEEEQVLKKDQNTEKISTAQGGKRLLEVQELVRSKIIAVDVREFKSSTPHYLYDAGFWIVPVHLTVGDFILSDDIAVEKKAVSTHDLHQSLNSGRLLKQITIMSKFYKEVVLLLEFDDSISFRLKEMYNTISDDKTINSSSVFSKLTLLLMNFPNVTCLWSKGQKDTVKMFQRLKKNGQNPDLARVEKIGKVLFSKVKELDLDDINEYDDDAEARNKHLPHDFLRSLPGITNKNIPVLFKKVKNIKNL